MRPTLLIAAILGACAVLLGAFAAHAFGGRLSPQALGWVDTASRYQLFHAAALVGLAFGMRLTDGRLLPAVAILLAVGTVLFSGSLYALAFSGWRPVAMVAPVGGTAMIFGWVLLGIAAFRLPRRR